MDVVIASRSCQLFSTRETIPFQAITPSPLDCHASPLQSYYSVPSLLHRPIVTPVPPDHCSQSHQPNDPPLMPLMHKPFVVPVTSPYYRLCYGSFLPSMLQQAHAISDTPAIVPLVHQPIVACSYQPISALVTPAH